MKLIRRFLPRQISAANALFILFLLIQFLPDKTQGQSFASYSVWFTAGLELILLLCSVLIKKDGTYTLTKDIFLFVFALLTAWVLFSAKLNLLKEVLFPAPGIVLGQMILDHTAILKNILSSLSIILRGYLIALAFAVSLGLVIGWNKRLGSSATYISKFLSSIPPIVYIPYAIALLSSLENARVFVIFLAAFWPVFAATMSGVLNVDKKIIESAKALNVGNIAILFRVILPAALPQIFIGCNQGLGVSFILLTSAEMIGGRSGLGYYVKYYSDFGDYKRLIAGIIVIGIVISVISFLVNKLQRYLLRWK